MLDDAQLAFLKSSSVEELNLHHSVVFYTFVTIYSAHLETVLVAYAESISLVAESLLQVQGVSRKALEADVRLVNFFISWLFVVFKVEKTTVLSSAVESPN